MTLEAAASLNLTEEFKRWWALSYPVPPAPHAVMTHTAFAEHIQNLQRPASPPAP